MPKRSFRAALVVVALTISGSRTGLCEAQEHLAKAPAESWTRFRGTPEMSGNSAATLPEKLRQIWKFETDFSIEAATAIADGIVYFPTMDGFFYALRLKDGQELWKFHDEQEAGSKSSPCLHGQLVYYGDEFGVLRALDRKTGKLRWQYTTDGEIISSPNWIDGKIIVGSYDASLYGLGAETGKLLWQVETQGPVHCSPSLAGDQVVVAGCDGFIRLVSVSQGIEIGSVEIGGNIASTPAVLGERLYFGTVGPEVICVDWKNLEQKWTYESALPFEFHSSPALTDDLVLIGGRDKMLHAIDRETGNLRWSIRTNSRVDSSPVVVGKRVFFGSADGVVYGIDLQTGKEVWRYVVGAPISAGLAVTDGHLLVGDEDGVLHCFAE